ncbi:MAG: alpha/beta hydrolase [Gammaproteobacteria bacterium]|nr:alpha/beta hydrolase [Gammaproteobacteria bacterium]
MMLVGTIVKWTLGIAALLAACGYLYQMLADRSANYQPPGDLLKIDGRVMHLLSMGQRVGPTVVLESGGSSSSLVLRRLQTQISQFASVAAYDRAGFGFSEQANDNRSFDDITNDLHHLLEQSNLPRPYLLVGVSMGGLMVRNYARLHPGHVKGIVLLDSAEEQHTFARIDTLVGMQRKALIGAWLARIGLVRVALTLAPKWAGIPKGLSAEMRHAIVTEFSRPSFYVATANELEAYFSTPNKRREAGGFGSLGSTPLTVVTHGKPLKGPQAFLEKGWKDAQHRLVSLSSNSKLVIAEQSGHAIGLDQPDLVIELIKKMLES